MMKKGASPLAVILAMLTIAGCTAIRLSQYKSHQGSLAELINRYRTDNGLPAIPISPSLTRVAMAHVKDLQERYRPNHRDGCNMHSWSSNGNWTGCCYTDDHKKAACMWNKPRELTSYKGKGFEIAASIHGARMNPFTALCSWKDSPGHHNVILNREQWSSYHWKAMGAAISKNYAVVWFGKEVDPATDQ